MGQTRIIWLAYEGYFEESRAVAAFDNESAAQAMVDSGLADDYDSMQLRSKAPWSVDSWYGQFQYGLVSNELRELSPPYRAKYEKGTKPSMATTIYRTTTYREPTPGHPQPMGSGKGPGDELIVTVSHAKSKAKAMTAAMDRVRMWKVEEGFG